MSLQAVALSTALAVQPAILKTFTGGENMAEITAKSQAQHVVVDNVGLALAVALTKVMRTAWDWRCGSQLGGTQPCQRRSGQSPLASDSTASSQQGFV